MANAQTCLIFLAQRTLISILLSVFEFRTVGLYVGIGVSFEIDKVLNCPHDNI